VGKTGNPGRIRIVIRVRPALRPGANAAER